MTWLTDSFWKVVWWFKHRTGFVDLHRDVTAVGRVLSLRSSSDGDALLNIELDASHLWLTPPTGAIAKYGHLHCEIPPWVRGPVRDVYATLRPGDRVAVSGRWGFDGVHLLPDHWPSWLFPIEVLAALWRHQPNFRDGWFEIHPVTGIERLED